MRTEVVVRVVENLRRYRVRNGKSFWNTSGPLTPQSLIPMATATQTREAERVMGTKKDAKLCAIRWVRVSRLRSTQTALTFRSLMWQVKHYRAMQRVFPSKDIDVRGVNLPVVVWAKGTPLIWNGNHRTTAAILLDEEWIRVRSFKKMRNR